MDTVIEKADLKKAMSESWYFIAGVEGIDEYVAGYEQALREWEHGDIGKPVAWFQVMGGEVNDFAFPEGWLTTDRRAFPADLMCLLFPLDGLDVTRLPLFKLAWQDRWFDDVIQNMRRR